MESRSRSHAIISLAPKTITAASVAVLLVAAPGHICGGEKRPIPAPPAHRPAQAPAFTPEERAKLAALRETINRSIERGGSFTDEEVEASIGSRLDVWESRRNGK